MSMLPLETDRGAHADQASLHPNAGSGIQDHREVLGLV